MRWQRAVLLSFAAATAAALGVHAGIPANALPEEGLPEIWKGRCASCHAVPDPEIRTDRAWLDQVHRTA